MKYGLSEKMLEQIVNFIAEYPVVESAVLFGSRPHAVTDISLYPEEPLRGIMWRVWPMRAQSSSPGHWSISLRVTGCCREIPN